MSTSAAQERKTRFDRLVSAGQLTGDARIKLFPMEILPAGEEFSVYRRDTRSQISTGEAGVEALRLLERGLTLGETRQQLAARYRCVADEVDLTPLLETLVHADFVREAGGVPISTSPLGLRGRLRQLWTHFLWPSVLTFAIQRLPLPLSLRLVHLRAARRNERMVESIEASMATLAPGRAPAEVRRLALANHDRVHHAAIDRVMLAALSARRTQRWLTDRVRVSGLEHLREAAVPGTGTIFCGFHTGSYSLLPFALAARGVPLTLLFPTDREGEAIFERKLEQLRAAGLDYPLRAVPGSMSARSLARRLEGGENVLLLCDAGLSTREESLPVPFLGRTLFGAKGTGWLSYRTGAPVVPMGLTYEAGERQLLAIEPAVSVRPGASAEEHIAAVTRAIHASLERRVAARPEQWIKWKDFARMSAPLTVEIGGR